jgi:hypothetical protein
MKCIKEDRIPLQVVPMRALQYNNQNSTECNVFLSRLVAELAKDLPTGFNIEFPQRVCRKFLFLSNFIVQKSDVYQLFLEDLWEIS